MRRPSTRILWSLMAVTLLAAPTALLRAEEGATFAAMQIAFSREVNAGIQYRAFARRADLEAQPRAACLFRVAAIAESVHAAHHAIAIERLEGKPTWGPEEFVVGTTAENLKTSIELELWERTRVYRQFADYARSEHLYEPLASIRYAQGAEATHERLFRMALGTLEHERVMQEQLALASSLPVTFSIPEAPAVRYRVCLGDGSLFTQPVKRCSNCGTGGDGIVDRSCPGEPDTSPETLGSAR